MTFFTKRYHPPGTPPGTLIESLAKPGQPLCIHLIDYNALDFFYRENVTTAGNKYDFTMSQSN